MDGSLLPDVDSGSLGVLFPDLLASWDFTKNSISPFSVPAHSNKYAFWLCPVCSFSYRQVIGKKTGKNPQGCPACSNKKVFPGHNDLETLYPDIACELSSKNPFKADEIVAVSKKKAFWVCSKCKNEYEAPISNRSRNGTGCPYCSNKKVLSGFNDLATKYSEILSIWDFAKNEKIGLKPDEVVPGSAKRAFFRCSHGHGWSAQIREVAKSIEHGTQGCPKCSRKTSFGEIAVFYYLNRCLKEEVFLGKKVGPEKREADIFIPALNIVIEYDGIFWHSSADSVLRDAKKESYFRSLDLRVIRIKESKRNQAENDLIEFIWDGYEGRNLNWAISELLKLFACSSRNFGADFVDVKRDWKEIRSVSPAGINSRSLTVTHPKVAAKWDYEKNGELDPESFTYGSNQKVYWVCSICGQSYKSPIKFMTYKNSEGRDKCPYCSGAKVAVGVNDLSTTYPELAREIDPEKNQGLTGRDISAGSNKPILWTCAKCGYEWTVSPNSRISHDTKHPYGCPQCAGLAKIRVKNIRTGKIYNSIRSAAKECGHEKSSFLIHRACEDGIKAFGDFWEYA